MGRAKEKWMRLNALLLALIILMSYLMGHGTFLVFGLSSAQSEKKWCDSTMWAPFNEGGLRKADFEIDYSCLYLLHRDVVIRESVRWLFSGEIKIMDDRESQARKFVFWYQNVSSGYMSSVVSVEYDGNSASGDVPLRFDELIKFYRPGEYVLHVVDRLIDSNMNFTGYGRVLVYDEVFRMTEEFEDRVTGFFMIILGLMILLVMITGWVRFGFVVSWVNLKYEWKSFWGSAYGDVMLFFWLIFFFDLLTTFVALSHGGWEANDFFRVDMAGGIWFSIVFFLGLGLFLFCFLERESEEKVKKNNKRSISPSWLVYSTSFGGASVLRLYVVASNLWVISLVGGYLPFQMTLIAILVFSLIFVIWLGRRIHRRKRGIPTR